MRSEKELLWISFPVGCTELGSLTREAFGFFDQNNPEHYHHQFSVNPAIQESNHKFRRISYFPDIMGTCDEVGHHHNLNCAGNYHGPLAQCTSTITSAGCLLFASAEVVGTAMEKIATALAVIEPLREKNGLPVAELDIDMEAQRMWKHIGKGCYNPMSKSVSRKLRSDSDSEGHRRSISNS